MNPNERTTLILPAGMVDLGKDNQGARSFILEMISLCSNSRTLSRLLLHHVINATGSIYVLMNELVVDGDWSHHDFSRAYEADDLSPYNPHDTLVSFVSEFLRSGGSPVVLVENYMATPENLATWWWPPPRIAVFNRTEPYHVVTPDMTDRDQIEASVIRRSPYQVGICASCSRGFGAGTIEEADLAEAAANSRYVFVPAFDQSGYLVWCIERA